MTNTTVSASTTNTAAAPERERILFNDDWRFQKGDPADVAGQFDYAKIQDWVTLTGEAEFVSDPAKRRTRPGGNAPGENVSCAQTGFDDGGWRRLDLPHDWGVEGPFDQDYPGETGKLPWWGVAWYRKRFAVPASDRSRQVFLDMDGAMSHAAVWLNGKFVGGWPYGYASFRLDLTPHLRPGEENVLAVRLDNPPDSSRWYPGVGIYRNVWLVKTAAVHVAHWGTYLTTPEVSDESATVDLRVIGRERTGNERQCCRATQIHDSARTDAQPKRPPPRSTRCGSKLLPVSAR
jgi:beta-galactosidase